MPISAAPLAPELKEGIVAAASDAGLRSDRLNEVAAVDESAGRAGTIVGNDGAGSDFVAFYTHQGFTGFVPLERALRKHGPMLLISAAQPDRNGETGHVQVLGVAEPGIATVKLNLTNGATIGAELVEAGEAGYHFFIYTSDDPSSFPAVFHAYADNGDLLATHDVSREIKPPGPASPDGN